MKDLIWFPGATPHVGWWLTKYTSGEFGLWRWWDGEVWSVAFHKTSSLESIRCHYERPAQMQERLTWSIYYPKKPRVPRLDPTRLSQREINFFELQAHINMGGSVSYLHGNSSEEFKPWDGALTLGHPRYVWRLQIPI